MVAAIYLTNWEIKLPIIAIASTDEPCFGALKHLFPNAAQVDLPTTLSGSKPTDC